MATFTTPAGAEVPGDPEGSALAGRDRAILEFERGWWQMAGAKESAMKREFGLTSVQYFQELNRIIETPEALAADPLLVNRLRRQRDARRRRR